MALSTMLPWTYVRILGGKVIKAENPCYIKLANTWIIPNFGGGPTPDKPEVLLETPSDLNRVNSFLNLRVADIWACYKQRGDKGAYFLTEPLNNHGWEWRCYMRDPDGYLIEVGQYTKRCLIALRTKPVKSHLPGGPLNQCETLTKLRLKTVQSDA